MKLSTRDALAALAKPDLNKIGVLIYGANAIASRSSDSN